MKNYSAKAKICAKSSIVALVLSSVGFTAPAFAVDDSAIILEDSVCQLAGAGTATNPYQVATAKQLAEITSCNNGIDYKYYVQTSDINITPTSDGSQNGWNDTNTGGWVPIGDWEDHSALFTVNNPFIGTFDGQNHAITGLTIDRESDVQGLFTRTEQAEIKNLVLGDVSGTIQSSVISSGGNSVGALAGFASYTNVTNVSVSNINIQSNTYVGGLIGDAQFSTFNNVSYKGNISASGARLQYGGGIAGGLRQGAIHKASVESTIQGDYQDGSDWSKGDSVGGIVGKLEQSTAVDLNFTGDVNSSYWSGGIVGWVTYGSIDSAEFSGHVRGSHGSGNDLDVQYIGGIGGGFDENTAMTNVVGNGDVTATLDHSTSQAEYVGGIAGSLEAGTLSRATVNGNVEINGTGGSTDLNNSIGGIAGWAGYGTAVIDSVVKGNVKTVDAWGVGGIVGYGRQGFAVSRSSFEGDLVNTMTTTIQDYAYAGGIIGAADYGVIVISSSTSATASVSSTSDKSNSTFVGGLVGGAGGGLQITDSYNRASVTGYDKVAGILGSTDRTGAGVSIIHTYTTGTVTANGSATAKDVFANSDPLYPLGTVAGQNTFDKSTSAAEASATGVVGNTTEAMKTKATFTALGFDFDSPSAVWAIKSSINDGYPYLIHQALVAGNQVPQEAPAITPVPAKKATTDVFGSLKFKKGTAKLTKESKAMLMSYGALIKAGGYTKVTIRVYTTNSNTRLSTIRANAIAKALKKQGVTVSLKKEAITRSSKKLNNKAKLFAKQP